MAIASHHNESSDEAASVRQAVACVVDADVLESARKDPQVRATLEDAQAYGQQLELEARVHP
jgi:hypothetical protein